MKDNNILILAMGARNIHITKNITSIIFDESFDTSEIKSVKVDDDNPAYCVKNNCLINRKTGTVELLWNGFGIPEDEGIEEIGDYAFFSLSFDYSKKLTVKIPEGIARIGAHAFSNPQVSNVILPFSSKEFGYRAFAGSSLKQIFIPENVEQIGIGAFHNCQLEKINVSEENRFYYSENNCLIEKETGRLMACINDPVIPEGVRIIEQLALAGLINTRSVYLPSSLEEIRMSEDLPKLLQFPVSVEENGYGNETKIVSARFYVIKGSYGEEYCIANNLPYITIFRKENNDNEIR